jgi:hypothetical protein
MINDFSQSPYRCRMLLRELIILRKFSEMKENIFTTKILDVILPSDVTILQEKSINGKVLNNPSVDLMASQTTQISSH